MTDFAAAVAEYQEALAVFDHPRLTEDPLARETVRHDWNAIREPAVLAEEAALERDFGCGTRSAGGGGERCGRAPAREMPAADFRPTHARIRDALRKLGTATAREITVEAKTSHAAGGWLTEALKRGEVKHDGGYPRRWRWVGPASLPTADRELVDEAADLIAGGMPPTKVCQRFRSEHRMLAGREVTPAWLTKTVRTNETNETNETRQGLQVHPEPAGVVESSKAADEPQEVEKMTKGRNVTEERVLSAMNGYESNTPEGIAARLACGPDAVAICLRGLRRAGRVTSQRGSGKGGPMVWKIGGSTPVGKASPTPPKKAKRTAAPASGSIASLLEREIDRQASLRAAAILRAHADAIEAEAGG